MDSFPSNMTPSQAEQAQKSMNFFSSPHLFRMMEGKEDDRPFRTFQAGYKFFIAHDKITNALKYWVRLKGGDSIQGKFIRLVERHWLARVLW
jgi:hypothetical protein